MRETYSTIRHLLHLATELDRACALFLSTHVSITHDEARVLLELGAAQQSLRPGALAKQLNLQPSTLSRVLRNLENRGFIERHRTTEDARSLSLSLTYLGARTAKETEQTLDRFFDGLGKHLGYDDLDSAHHGVEYRFAGPSHHMHRQRRMRGSGPASLFFSRAPRAKRGRAAQKSPL